MIESQKNKTAFIILFIVVLFLSSSLLFTIQPIIGKIVTAKYGGGAQVWCLSLFFFQFLLFVGYSFSFILCRQKMKYQILIYGLLVTASFFFSEIPWGNEWIPKNFENPTFDLLIKYFLYLGLPCFLLCTVSTMLQKWYFLLGWGEPYYLYGISNIGSLLCLLAYPFIIEPYLNISDSLLIWRILLIINCTLLVFSCLIFFSVIKTMPNKTENINLEKPTRNSYMWWLTCSAMGTMLLVSITQYITRDIAPIPLLWLAPLLIYLLSFVLNFKNRPLYTINNRAFYIIFTQILVLVTIHDPSKNFQELGLYLVILFLATIIVHGELYQRKPSAVFLPFFYLMIALGGMLGSVVVNFIFPAIMNANFDHYIVLAFFIFLSFFILGVEKIKIFHLSSMDKQYRFVYLFLCMGLMAILMYDKNTIMSRRNFYGSISIKKVLMTTNETYLGLNHGITTHGIQLQDPIRSHIPTTYYNYNSPIALVIEYFNEQKNDEGLNIGVVGLGIGTLASYLKVDDQLRFYEIDPKIVKIAQDKFTFLLRSKGHISIKLGDGRILLDQEKEQKYDILLIDAFNSDAIPTHLLTTEAFKIYRKHLNQNGVLVFHVTNTFLTLDKICEKNAMDLNLISLTLNAAPTNVYQAESTYTIVSESDQFIVQVKKLLDTNQYKNIKIINNSESEKIKTWTDSYSNIFSVMKVDTKRIRH